MTNTSSDRAVAEALEKELGISYDDALEAAPRLRNFHNVGLRESRVTEEMARKAGDVIRKLRNTMATHRGIARAALKAALE